MNKTPGEKEAVLNAFAAMIRPLMRAAFEYGITASEISAVVRRTYIQALERKLVEQNRPATDARLAVVAGLAKSDVESLREAARSGAPHSLRRTVSLDQVTNVLTVWHTRSGFSGAYGLALELDLQPIPSSPRRSFKELVEIACPGADLEAVLDELVASGSVEVIDSTTVRCLSRAYVQKGADIQRIDRMGRFLAAISSNFVHNLLRGASEPIYFERAVISDFKLTEAGRDKFLGASAERGQELLTELDTFLTRLAATEGDESGKRYGLGIYFFDDAQSNVAELPAREPTGEKRAPQSSPNEVEEIDVLATVSRKI